MEFKKEDEMNKISYRVQQDECAPDSLEEFEKSLAHITGVNLGEFKNAGECSESNDGLRLEWRLGFWILEYDGDDPFHKLRRVDMFEIEVCSIRACASALEKGQPVFAHWFKGRELISAKAYVESIHSDYFCDTNGEERRFDVGWSDSKEASYEAFKRDILSALD
jgi:hypothetical protein